MKEQGCENPPFIIRGAGTHFDGSREFTRTGDVYTEIERAGEQIFEFESSGRVSHGISGEGRRRAREKDQRGDTSKRLSIILQDPANELVVPPFSLSKGTANTHKDEKKPKAQSLHSVHT